MKKLFTTYLPSLVFVLFVFVLAVLFLVLPKKEMSELEKSKLATMPPFTVQALVDGSYTDGLQTYVSDHFPAREWFVGVHSYAELLTGRGTAGDVYVGKDGYLIGTAENFSASTVAVNTENYAAFAEYLGLDATIMVVPSTGYILDDKLPAVHKDYPDDAMFDAVKKNAASLTVLDVRESFKTSDKQLY